MTMKTTITHKELVSFDACKDRLETFNNHHGVGSTVKLSEALESNGSSDLWWGISKIYEDMSDVQKLDLRLLACDYAERVLPIFEKQCPNDSRPKDAINISRLYAKNEAIKEELDAVGEAAWDAARAARAAAGDVGDAARAAGAAARAAAGDAWSAARAAGDAEKKWQTEKLMKLLKKWEL